MGKSRIHRILLAMDAGSPITEALEAAVDLALEQDAELHLMFGENHHLREAAGLPFSREVEFKSTAERDLSPQQVERSLRSLARQLKKTFSQTLQTTRLRGSFLLHQGTKQQLLQRCGGGDVLWLSPASLMIRIPSARRVPHDTLYLVYRKSPAGINTITIANNLLRRGYRRLVIFAAKDEKVEPLLELFPMPLEIIPLINDASTLQQKIIPRATNTLLLPEDYLETPQMEGLLEALSHSRLEILLVL